MKPIFIGGCSRSGTTMLGSMLGSHSRMLAVPESHFKIDIVRGLDGGFSRDAVPEALSLLRANLHFKAWKLNTAVLHTSVKDFDGSYRQFVEYFVTRYGANNDESTFDFWIDHTPSNTKHAPFLMAQFPEAKMLHLVRDGRAVAASILPLDWGPFTIKSAAEAWLLQLSSGFAAELSFPSDRVLRIQYEKIIQEPQATLSSICNFIGVEYEKGMELGKGFSVPGASKKQHSLVGSSPNPARIDAWREKLTSRQIELFEFFAGGMLEMMGYETVYGIAASSPTSFETFQMKVADLVKPYLKRFRYFKRHGEKTSSIIKRKITGKQQRPS